MVRNFILGVLVSVFAVACSSGNSPESAAKKYMQLRVDEKFEELVDYIAYEEGTTEEELKQGKAFVLALMQAGQSMAKEEAKVKSFEVGTAEMSEDGKSAKVKISCTLEDGSSKEEELNLKLIDGKWLWAVE